MEQKKRANGFGGLANSTEASLSPEKHSEEVKQILISIEATLTGMDGRLSLIEILYQEFQALRESLESVSKHNKSLQDSVSSVSNKLTVVMLENQQIKEEILGLQADGLAPKCQRHEENVPVQSQLKGTGFGLEDRFPRGIPDGRRKLVPIRIEAPKDDVQQVLADEGGVSSEQQEWSSSLGQESPQIKEEEEGADIPEFLLTSVPVKSENEEKPQSSQLQQNQTDENEEVEPRPSRSTEHKTEADGLGQYKSPHVDTSSFTLECPETDNTDNWEDARECRSFLNFLRDNRFSAREKLLSCPECSKAFKFNSELMRHVRTHTGEKPFSCSECGIRFGSKGTLKTHSTIHTGERPFSCSQCGKRFRANNSLIRHMKVHSGHRPFHCLECGKTFRFRHHLKEHTRIHTGEKPYECNICGKRCAQTSTLKYHMRCHTGAAQFTKCVLGPVEMLQKNPQQSAAALVGENTTQSWV